MDVILELMNGQKVTAALAKPFMPEDNEVDVLIKGSREKQKFLFPEICCILLKDHRNWMFLFQKDTSQEEVTTFVGKTYHVRVSDTQEKQFYPTGFFGLSIQEDTPYKLIFFTMLGVKSRCQKRALGEILQAEGMISSDSMKKLLGEQQRLKKRLVGEIISDSSKLTQGDIENTLDEAKRAESITPRVRIGELLIEAGLVTKEQVDKALAAQEGNKKKKIGELLIDNKLITEDQLLAALSTKFRLQMVDLTKMVPNMKALEALPSDVVHRLQVIPVMDKGDRLMVATSQPTDHSIAEHLRFYTGRRIEMVVAPSRQISEAIEKYYPSQTFAVDDLIGELSVDQTVEEESEEVGLSETDSQIVNLVNKVLMDGYAKGASDIHFEPGLRGQPFQVRYRIDGICRVMHQIPTLYKRAIISRLKIIANLDITERRKPQSGKILLKHRNNRVEYRVEITPTTGNNEDAVLRILANSKPLPLDQMGLSATNEKAFRVILSEPNGIILCVGPTGSGKTTTLHSVLGHLNTPDRKIWTAEDPVEITQPGLRQVQIQSRIGLTFAEVLRSFLRADPDVIMIGEMRDEETAKTAIEASLTGHLVLSTLHTNSAPETITRLIEMGMDPFNFADALLGILAQRLARRLCDRCKQSYHPSEEEFAELVRIYEPHWFEKHNMQPYSQEMMLMRKGGCENCNGTGYRGRLALHELAVGTENLKNAIKERDSGEALRTLAIQEGMRTLLMDGVQKIFGGLTDLEQVLKVCRSQSIGSVQ
ncbi:MAG: ATPase, T2SS/T4P/T4SS family [Syntrophales bacterium]|nr:ATPase, T2SS/T4P/T4SS family [Syntrophales bacterium]